MNITKTQPDALNYQVTIDITPDDYAEALTARLKEYTSESFDKFVEKMVSYKEEAGQFEQAEITIREMNIVKSKLKSYLQQLYHERIVYTKREGEN